MNDDDFVARLKLLFRYDPFTGKLFWLVNKRGHHLIGREAGSLKRNGYISISIDGKRHQAHRIIWAMAHGKMPQQCIDHINGDKADNRLENLRSATVAENTRNAGKPATNSSGYKGVYFEKGRGKWRAKISVMNRDIHIGYFGSCEDAVAAYQEKSVLLHGAFARLA